MVRSAYFTDQYFGKKVRTAHSHYVWPILFLPCGIPFWWEGKMPGRLDPRVPTLQCGIIMHQTAWVVKMATKTSSILNILFKTACL